MSLLTIRRLRARNWRNLSDMQLDFSPGCNQIVGSNAQGKTNLLEALYFLIVGRSFRTRLLSDLMGPAGCGFYLELEFSKYGVEQQVRIACQGTERKIFYNHTPCHSLTELLGIVPGVLLSPEDSEIVKGAPACRRDFLDLMIAQFDPLFVHHQTRYAKAMRHRNHLLRLQKLKSIESWEHEMAVCAAYIVPKRIEAIHRLEQKAHHLQQVLSNNHDLLQLQYKGTAPATVENYLKIFASARQKEILLGQTLYGPHKDDLFVSINGRDARQFASEGQQRSLVAALRIAHWEHLFETLGEKPVMLIDDLGMGLDAERRENLMRSVQSLGQTFMSMPDAAKQGACFHVHQGNVTHRSFS